MNPHELDELFRASVEPIDLSSRRVDHLVRSVFVQLDESAAQPWWRSWRQGWSEWIFSGAPTVSFGRFATVLTIVCLLGIALGRQFEEPAQKAQTETLFPSTSLFPLES